MLDNWDGIIGDINDFLYVVSYALLAARSGKFEKDIRKWSLC